MLNNIKKNTYIKLLILSGVILIPFIGNVHLFDWDEINFAECAREMIVTGDYLRVKIDYEPFWEKPPLFIWFQVLCMKIFGINEFAARLPNALIGIISTLVLFSFGKKLYNEKFGIYWSLTYLGSFFPHFYFKSGIIDPMFNLFMFLSVYFIYMHYNYESKYRKYILFAGLFSGLAVLTKGPVGFLLPFITFIVYVIYNYKIIKIPFIDFLLYIVFTTIASLTWFGVEIATNGFWFINEFLKYQVRLLTTGDAGHSGPIYYHVLVLLFGCFPASFFIFNSFKKKTFNLKHQNNFQLIMIILLGVVVIIFSIVKTKIVHYSSLSYYPITFLAALTIYEMILKKSKLNNFIKYPLLIFGVFFSLILIAIPFLMYNKEWFINKITNEFVLGNLSTNVEWQGWEALIGVLTFSLIVLSFIYFNRNQIEKGIIIIFSSMIITIFLYLPFVLPKIEQHVQGAPIEFYKTKQDRPVYVSVLSFKSYSHLFYTNKPYFLSANNKHIDHEKFNDWLILDNIDKPAYFVCKVQDQKEWLIYPELRKLYEKGGFAFFERLPK